MILDGHGPILQNSLGVIGNLWFSLSTVNILLNYGFVDQLLYIIRNGQWVSFSSRIGVEGGLYCLGCIGHQRRPQKKRVMPGLCLSLLNFSMWSHLKFAKQKLRQSLSIAWYWSLKIKWGFIDNGPQELIYDTINQTFKTPKNTEMLKILVHVFITQKQSHLYKLIICITL